MKKTTLGKLFVIFLAAVICGLVTGVVFSIYFYGLVPRSMLAEVYLSDTPAKMHLRFWIAFAAGAIIGIVWSYKVVKDIE